MGREGECGEQERKCVEGRVEIRREGDIEGEEKEREKRRKKVCVGESRS